MAAREFTFIQGIDELLPAGLKGLMLVGMLAALASTVDTHLNWGASYWTNDVYRRFICQSWLKRAPIQSCISLGGAWKQCAYFSHCPLYSSMAVLNSNGLASEFVIRGRHGNVARVAVDLVAYHRMGRISLHHDIDRDGATPVVGFAGSRGIAVTHHGYRFWDDRHRGLVIHWPGTS